MVVGAKVLWQPAEWRLPLRVDGDERGANPQVGATENAIVLVGKECGQAVADVVVGERKAG